MEHILSTSSKGFYVKLYEEESGNLNIHLYTPRHDMRCVRVTVEDQLVSDTSPGPYVRDPRLSGRLARRIAHMKENQACQDDCSEEQWDEAHPIPAQQNVARALARVGGRDYSQEVLDRPVVEELDPEHVEQERIAQERSWCVKRLKDKLTRKLCNYAAADDIPLEGDYSALAEQAYAPLEEWKKHSGKSVPQEPALMWIAIHLLRGYSVERISACMADLALKVSHARDDFGFYGALNGKFVWKIISSLRPRTAEELAEEQAKNEDRAKRPPESK